MHEVGFYHFLKGWILAISNTKKFKIGKIYITVEDDFGESTRYSIDGPCDSLNQSKRGLFYGKVFYYLRDNGNGCAFTVEKE